MNTITPEVANAWLRQLFDESAPQEQSSNPEDSIPWEEKRPLRWADFLAILTRDCEHRGWEILSDSPGDFSLAIFAHQEQATDGAEALQERLPFENDSDALPF